MLYCTGKYNVLLLSLKLSSQKNQSVITIWSHLKWLADHLSMLLVYALRSTNSIIVGKRNASTGPTSQR